MVETERFPAPPGESGLSHKPKERAKYRMSCDRCQNIKVRCNKDKPACSRCIQKGFSCVYSPMSRIGRPRKFGRILSADDAHVEHTFAISDSHQEQSDSRSTTRVINTPEMNAEVRHSSTSASPEMDPNNNSTGNNTQEADVSQLGRDSSTVFDGAFCRPGMNISASHYSNGATTIHSETNLGTPTSMFVQTPRAENSSRLEAECYVTILSQTTKLEQSLIIATGPPPIDLLLKAESDLRALNHSLSTCKGHGRNVRGCLMSDRPISLALALLAERIVTMLEETFQLAAERATTGSSAIEDQSGNALPATSARRLERSFRGILNLPCVFPVPADNVDMRIGNQVVDGIVKARALKKILQLRIRKLMGVLEWAKKLTYTQVGADFRAGPLDWGNSTAVMADAAGLLIEDLIRRLAALQGGLTLMGGDF
ncbi:hypothetical protein GX51_05315 [Blastomyces parvus]|uniref:Zn(2)-C6 fungal-type domain-containing protein n=1 Tax=Blastomyces parvus TaxID=2060905 RepID=A0A2B7WXE9_9EURO|nr:hypothetical protein GX51_05315 [Blastomyces parvus]